MCGQSDAMRNNDRKRYIKKQSKELAKEKNKVDNEIKENKKKLGANKSKKIN